jgi:hypothetical protein
MKVLLVAMACCGLCGTASAVSEAEIYEKGAPQEAREALQQKKPLPWKKDGFVVSSAEVAKAIHRAVAGA